MIVRNTRPQQHAPGRRRARIAVWATAWAAFAVVVVVATIQECANNGCRVVDAAAFAGATGLLLLVCVLGGVVALVWVGAILGAVFRRRRQ